MLKTIKITKQLGLDELIKYCRENDIKNKRFYSSTCVWLGLSNGEQVKIRKQIIVDEEGSFNVRSTVNADDTFTVEEPITKDTEFDFLVYVSAGKGKNNVSVTYFQSINTILKHSGSIDSIKKIYALIDNNLEIIWEREEE